MPFISFHLGSLLMAGALWRGRIGTPWVPALIVVGIVVEFLGPAAFHAQLYFGLFLLAFGWIGTRVLRMSDTEWERDAAEALSGSNVIGQPAIVNG
jgi:hypothetical protein